MERKKYPLRDLRIAATLSGLGSVLASQGKAQSAESLLREALEIREQRLAAGHVLIAVTQSALGESLSSQGKTEEAECLLIAGYEGILAGQKKSEPILNRRLAESIQRLIKHFETAEKPEEAAKWESMLENSQN